MRQRLADGTHYENQKIPISAGSGLQERLTQGVAIARRSREGLRGHRTPKKITNLLFRLMALRTGPTVNQKSAGEA
jgi:hypothetical protein